jgi:hypothetical protein
MSRAQPPRTVEGVVFDLDGVLVDSEHLWEESWRAYCRGFGRSRVQADILAAQGMSSPELARHIAEHVGRPDAATEVAEWCIFFTIDRIVEDDDEGLMGGALDLVTTVSSAVPIALASSAGPPRDRCDPRAPQFRAPVRRDGVERASAAASPTPTATSRRSDAARRDRAGHYVATDHVDAGMSITTTLIQGGAR